MPEITIEMRFIGSPLPPEAAEGRRLSPVVLKRERRGSYLQNDQQALANICYYERYYLKGSHFQDIFDWQLLVDGRPVIDWIYRDSQAKWDMLAVEWLTISTRPSAKDCLTAETSSSCRRKSS